ncbi:MAG: hypothetical protein ACC651_12955 [Candidatus Scalindua sp.]
MSEQEIESLFPNLPSDGYSITSPVSPEYNCIAWAAGDTEVWWEPDPFYLSFWPSGIPRIYSLTAYISAYETLGYTVCHNDEYENGFEKIALYGDQNKKPTHAAKQLNSGRWTSKLGQLEDIEHNTLEDLIGPEYGTIAVIMKRPKQI